MRSFWTLSALLLVFPFAGCSQEQAPDAAMQTIATSLSENKPQVAWEGLPPSYQKEVDDLVHEFADKMDPEIWDGGFNIAKKIVRIMDEKRDFIQGHQILTTTTVNMDAAKENWDALVKALSILVNSELSDLEELKTINVETFLAGTGAEFMEQMPAVVEITGQQRIKDELAHYKDAKFKLLETKGDTALVEFTYPDEDVEKVEMVKVEGKWISKELADEWPTRIQEARDILAKIPVENMKKNKVQLLAKMKMFDTHLTLLLDAKTAEQFNTKAQQMASMVMATIFSAGTGPATGPDPAAGGFESTPGGSGSVPDDLPQDSPSPGEPSSDNSFSPASDENAPAVTVPAEEE